jgi:hypothetical protein
MLRVTSCAAVFVAIVSLGCGSLHGDLIREVIFDSYTGPNVGGFTSPDLGGTSQISVSQTRRITNISVLNRMWSVGQVKFVIFSHPGYTLLFESPPQSFGPDVGQDPTWKMSDDFSFTLLAGNDYHIGYTSNVGRDDVVDEISESQNGITSALQISVIEGFEPIENIRPFWGGADQGFRLYVPEPSTLVLLSMGAVGPLAHAWRRRNRM